MHLVILAWLFVTFTMALTLDSVASGIALFVLVGLAPVALYWTLALRRRRSAAASTREERIHERDDRDAEPDR